MNRKRSSSERLAYDNMKSRCYNENSQMYHNYGGRGITVCQRWLNGFDNFIADMGYKPDPTLSLDRINNDGNYEPTNCRWATRTQQALNRRPRTKKPPVEQRPRKGFATALAIYAATGRPKDIAAQYGVTPPTVRDIKKGRTWADVTGHQKSK